MTIVDDRPDVAVDPREYIRLLGYPPGTELDGRARELADWAQDWYAARGTPWVRTVRLADADVSDRHVRFGGTVFSPSRLRRLMADAGSREVVVAAVSAGAEAEAYAQALWEDGRPDEYFFLEIYASAVVEHLVTATGARLCAEADRARLAVLPHDSPGYPGWAIAEQAALLAVLNAAQARGGPVALDVLDSGMLRPKKSLLAVFGLTPELDRVARLTSLVPCDTCSLRGCAFRRRPYRRDTTAPVDGAAEHAPADRPAALTPGAQYSVNRKALARWAAERLVLTAQPDGSIEATFRYDGTTCSNMGRPLAFVYDVTLGPEAEGYPIRSHRSAPAPGDAGHAAMCRFLTHGQALLDTIAAERPLEGRRLEDVLTWPRPNAPAGCYCDVESREHKWGLVFETIHYALVETGAAPPIGAGSTA